MPAAPKLPACFFDALLLNNAKKGITDVSDQDDSDDETLSPPKPVAWIGSSLKDLRGFPKAIRTVFGQALFAAQIGRKHSDAKPLKGFGGAGVLEVVEDDDGSTYRAVYTVRFAGIVYVLHVFQKKSKSGIKTPIAEIDRIRTRLKVAEEHYADWKRQNPQG